MVHQNLRWEVILARVMYTASELLCWNFLRGGNLMTGNSPCSTNLISINGIYMVASFCNSIRCLRKSNTITHIQIFIMIRSRPRGEQFLVRWATPQLHDIDALSRMVDPSLKGAYPSKSLSRLADIISLCLQVIFLLSFLLLSFFDVYMLDLVVHYLNLIV